MKNKKKSVFSFCAHYDVEVYPKNFRLIKNRAKKRYIEQTKLEDKLCILYFTKGVTQFLRN